MLSACVTQLTCKPRVTLRTKAHNRRSAALTLALPTLIKRNPLCHREISPQSIKSRFPLARDNLVTASVSMRSLLLLLLLLPLLLLAATVLPTSHAAAVEGQQKALLGGWTPIKDLNDPHIREIADFALAKHNKQANDRLTLRKVVKGESQVVSGGNYRLTLVATGGDGAAAQYEAVVWEQPWRNFKQLMSFKPVKG